MSGPRRFSGGRRSFPVESLRRQSPRQSQRRNLSPKLITMADIIFLPDPEEGHLFPTFKVARDLEKAGFSVCYVGVRDLMESVVKQGFAYHVILEDVYPQGYARQIVRNMKPAHAYFMGEEAGHLIKRLNPRLLIISWVLPLETLLLHYRFKIPLIIYHAIMTYLDAPDRSLARVSNEECTRQLMKLSGGLVNQLLAFMKERRVAFKTFTDLLGPLDEAPRFLMCPGEFDIGGNAFPPEHVCLGPCIRESLVGEQDIAAKYLSPGAGRKIILGSAGSQTAEYPERARRFFTLLIEAVRQMPDYYLILSVGKVFAKGGLGEIPPNVLLAEWLPQVELLAHASVAVIHGGLGAIKECIYNGVPMLVVPMGRDQMDNARRVEEHNLGIAAELEHLSAEKITGLIAHVHASESIQSGMARMRTIFHEKENGGAGVTFINACIGPPRRVLPLPHLTV